MYYSTYIKILKNKKNKVSQYQSQCLFGFCYVQESRWYLFYTMLQSTGVCIGFGINSMPRIKLEFRERGIAQIIFIPLQGRE